MKNETLKKGVFGLFYIAVLLVNAHCAPSLEPLGFIGEMERKLNRRLYAIIRDPSLMTRLNQEGNFQTLEAAVATRVGSLSAARKVLPEVFSATNIDQAVTAICLADERVYFWLAMDECVLVGWVPMIRKDKLDLMKNGLVLWLVPLPGKRARLIDAWQNRLAGRSDSFWLADVLRTGLGVDLAGAVLTSQSKTTLQGRIVLSREEHSIVVNATEHVVQIEIALLSKAAAQYSGKPATGESLFNDMPMELPFWPPAED